MTSPATSDQPMPPIPRNFGRLSLFQWGVFLAVSIAVLTPLTFLVLGSFSANDLPTDFSLSELTLENYKRIWLDPETYTVFYNTVVYVVGATAFGISMAAILAWLVERTNVPGKVWIYAGVPMTLAMPGMLQAMAYVLLLSPRIGFLNKLIEPLGLGPINIYSLGGMIFIEGLRLVPTAFLMLVPLLRSMDPSLEEAAAMSGANPQSTIRKVTWRLMLPGLLAVTIYQFMTALEVFEVPGILGLPAQIYVFSTKIYTVLHSVNNVPAYGDANALAMIYVLVALVATWLYARVIVRSERFTIITGKGYRPRELDLGRWRWPAIGLVFVFMLFSIILPFLVLLYVSFLPYLQIPSVAAFQVMSAEHYIELWEAPEIGQVMRNTIYLIVITSTLTVLVSFMISLVIVRTKFRHRRLLDQLAFMPHAIPGIVMGLAFLWLFLQLGKVGIDIHGGILAMSIAFTVGFVSYGTRSMNAAILQIHKDLEEAAYVSGAPRLRTTLRVFFPLLLPTFVGVWIWAMLLAVRQAGKPLILYEGADNQVLSILIWNMWDGGEIEAVGAIGTVLIVSLLVITLLLRRLGFGRGAAIQQAGKQ
jgi:iron(III) transport system permease protein